MEMKEKINIIEDSCKRLLRKDLVELNSNIDNEIEKRIKDELNEYQEKEEFTYNKKLEKMEKDFNKQIFNLEMNCKKEMLYQKKQIQKDLKKEVIILMKDFVVSNEYEEFLMLKIEEAIQKNNNTTNSILGIIEKDIQRFSDKIIQKYNIKLKTIDDKYIGGCILEDNTQGIYIDNTISNCIEENLYYNSQLN